MVGAEPDSGSRSRSFVLVRGLSILRIGGQDGSLESDKVQELVRRDEVISRPSSRAEDERRVVGPDLYLRNG